MKRTILLTLMLMTCSKVLALSVGPADTRLVVFAETIARAVFSNDLSAITSNYLPPNQGGRDETLKSWHKARETGDASGIQWHLCTVTVSTIHQQTGSDESDVVLYGTDGTRRFTLHLYDCREKDGKWLLYGSIRLDPKSDGGTTTPRTVPSPAPNAGEGQ